MTKNNQVFAFIILLLLTFAVSTAMAFARHRLMTSRGELPDTLLAVAQPPAVLIPHVEVGNSMPGRFRDTAVNAITGDTLLDRLFDTLRLSGRPVRILHLGDSHVAPGTFTRAMEATLQQAWAETGGAEVHFLGHNGATVNYFATPEWMGKIAAQGPDLIVASFGTNECHGMGYQEAQHRAMMQTFFTMLREACPCATILLTTPPGDYLSQRVSRRRRRASNPNPMTIRAAAEIRRFGQEEGMAVWDLHTIAGGSRALDNWIGGGFMQRDRVHFTPEGYQVQGRLLGEALLGAYNNYADRRHE